MQLMINLFLNSLFFQDTAVKMGEKIQVDFRHFVKLAKSNVISWDSLSTLLHEMASNFTLSRELNKVLLEVLKASDTKIRKILANEKDESIEGN